MGTGAFSFCKTLSENSMSCVPRGRGRASRAAGTGSYAMARAIVLVAVLCACGPVRAEDAVDLTCSGGGTSGDDGPVDCVRFLEGYQTEKGWRCDVPHWSDYLQTELPPDLWVELGGLGAILAMTQDAFCDKRIPDN